MNKLYQVSERIRHARSINDINVIIRDIEISVSGIHKQSVEQESLSAIQKQPIKGAEKKKVSAPILIDHTESKPAKNAKKVSAPILIDHTDSDHVVETPGAPLEGFRLPNLSVIRKHTKSLHLLYTAATDIDAIIASLEHTFSEAKNQQATLKNALAIQKQTHQEYGEVAALLSVIAEKHVPSQLRTFANVIQDRLIDLLDSKNYKECNLELFVNANDVVKSDTGTSPVGLEFCYYVTLEDLILDDESSDHPIPKYCIILTGVIHEKTIRYYLNAISEFLPPGKYPIGKEIHNEKELGLRLKLLLAIHKIVSNIEQRPMPYDTDHPKVTAIRGFKNVVDARIEDDALLVDVSTKTEKSDGDAACREIIAKITPLLTPIAGDRKTSPVQARSSITRIKARIRGGKIVSPRKTTIKFILIGKPGRGDSGFAITKHQLDDLKEGLSLTEKETADIKKILIRHRV